MIHDNAYEEEKEELIGIVENFIFFKYIVCTVYINRLK